MHAVLRLRPAGVVALVTKNPVKAGRIRRLDEDTVRLMQAAGFELVERCQSMLSEELGVAQGLPGIAADRPLRRERKSFFKRLHEQKNPHLRVDHEDVLWFRKQ